MLVLPAVAWLGLMAVSAWPLHPAPREGWDKDAHRLADSGDDALIWHDVPDAGDSELAW